MEGAAAQERVAWVRDRGMAVGAACAVAIALAAWPVRSVVPKIGADWSWVAALSSIAHHGMRFGDQIAWTYGPLGFLNTPYGPVLYYGDTLLASWLFTALVQLLLAGTLLVALRRSFPLALAALIAAVVLALTADRALALGFAWCALWLAREQDEDRRTPTLPLALGALTGVALLGRLNQGAELLLLAAVTLATVRRRRDALAFAGALLAAAAVGWLASGQAPADVWPYLRNGWQVVAGYAAAMGTSDPAHRWTYAAAAAIGLLALGLVWDAARGMPARRRHALLALWLLYALLAFKEGFTRQDPDHLETFFGGMLVPLAIVRPRESRRAFVLGGVAAGVIALAALVGLRDAGRSLNPYANASAAADQVRVLASPARRAQITEQLRASIASAYAVSPRLIAAIGRRSVMLWPYLYGEIAYAYDLKLRPLPSLEPYATYTPALDRLGVRLLASRRAPERIMRAAVANAPALDGRHPSFEAPRTALVILCRYRQIAAQRPWHVLARSADRCGAARALRTLDAPWGATVAVPRPRRADALVLARVTGAEPHGLEQLRALLLRPKTRWIALEGARYRLVSATAVEGLLLRAPARADYPPPFAMAPNPSRIAVGRDGDEPHGRVRYTFVEIPIRPFAGTTGAR